MNTPAFWVVIPAAGVGSRMRADRPKQYLELAGLTVIERTLVRFLSQADIAGIVVALSENDPYWAQLSCASDPRIECVVGGAERVDSVGNALNRLQGRADPEDWVLVHDAARPLLTDHDLNHLMVSLRDHPIGGILGTPVRDTMKRVDAEGDIEATVDRVTLWHALTPQMFRFGLLQACLSNAREQNIQITDEASAVEAAGLHPRLVEGRADNVKITRPEDLRYANWLLRDTSTH